MPGYRKKTIDVLQRFFSGDIARLATVRDEIFENNDIPEQNFGIFNEVLHGIVRRYRSLDAVIDTFSDYPLPDLNEEVHEILRLGIYELFFLDSVPEAVAINEAVDLGKQYAGKSSGGFINAVLRSVQREVTDETWDLPDRPTASGIEHLLPVRNGVCREFTKPVLPAPHGGPDSVVSFISAAFNYPSWIVERWLNAYGEEQTWNIARYQADVPPLFIRRNPLNCSENELKTRFQQQGVRLEPVSGAGFYRVPGKNPPETLPGFDEGCFSVQDPSEGKAIESLDLDPNTSVLDVCAAPGGKTTQLQERAEGEITIFAGDRDPTRLEKLRDNIRRLNMSRSIHPFCSDGRNPPFASETFDVLLLDVPCSNTGVLGRRVEARYHLENGVDEELLQLQKSLLESCLPLIKEQDGQLLYTSCSLLPEENEQLLSEILGGREGIRLHPPEFSFPTEKIPTGGFAARIDSTSETF